MSRRRSEITVAILITLVSSEKTSSAPPGPPQPAAGVVQSNSAGQGLTEIAVEFMSAITRGEFTRARDLGDRMVASHTKIYGSNDWRLPSYREACDSVRMACALPDVDQRLFHMSINMGNESVSCLEQGEIAKAHRLAAQSCHLREVLLGKDAFFYSAVLEVYAEVQTFYMEMYPEGLRSYRSLIDILKAEYGNDCPEVALVAHGLGAAYTLLGQYDQAESSLNPAASIIRRHCGERSIEYAKCLYYLGQLDLERHDFGRARERLEESLATVTRKDPVGYPNIAAVRFAIARTYMGEKEFFRAKVLLRAILPDYEKLPACYPTRVQMLDAYATTLRQLNQFSEAEQIEGKAREIRSLAQSMRGLVLGPSTPLPPTKEVGSRDPAGVELREAELENRYAQLLDDGDFQQARGALKSLVEILAARLGQEHWQVVSAKRDLETLDKVCLLTTADRSLMREAIRRSAEAVSAARSCSGLEERPARESCRLTQLFLGEDNSVYLNALEVVGWAELNRGDPRSALQTFQKVNVRQKARFGDQHHMFASSLQGMGVCHTKLKKLDTAESLIRASMAIVARDLGTDSNDYAASLHHLGGVELERQAFERAKALFDQALAIYTPRLGKSHPLCLDVQLDVSRVLVGKRDLNGAHAMLRDLTPQFEKLPDCPLRADMLELYAITLRELKRSTEAESFEKQAAEMRVRVAELNGASIR